MATYMAYQVATFPNDTQNQKVEYVIILGAKAYGDLPSPVFRERIQHGLILLSQGRAKKIIFTGGSSQPSQAQVAKTFALQAGIPEESIITEERSLNTWGNLSESKKLLPPDIGPVLLVSDPYHLKRAVLMAQDMGLQVIASPTESTRFQSFWSKTKFLTRETGEGRSP